MTNTADVIARAAGRTSQLAGKGAAPVVSIFDWLRDNSHGLMLGGLVALGIVGLMLLLRWGGERMLASDPECRHWRGIVGNVLGKTGVFFMVAAAIDIVVNYAAVPPKLARLSEILFIVAGALQVAVWAREIILGVIRSRVGEDPGASTVGNAMSLIRVLVSVAAFAIAFIVILDNLGVNVTALVAGLGVGGIAIGLAAQGIFSDLFAALAIVFDKPFRRGDTVRYGGAGGTVGTVERIGLKTTRIRAVSGEQVIIANTKLLEQELTNVAEARVRRTWLPFGVTYQTPSDVIENFPQLLEEAFKPIRSARLIRCCAVNFGDSAINCELVYDDRSSEADTLARHKSTIILSVMRIFAREKIDFAYPTQTTFTSAPDGTMIMPYPAVQPVTAVTSEAAAEADVRKPARG